MSLQSRTSTLILSLIVLAATSLGGCSRQDDQSQAPSRVQDNRAVESQVIEAPVSPPGSSDVPAPAFSPIDSPATDPAKLCEDASLALQAGDGEIAYDLARQAFRLAPEDPQCVFLMARILGQRHRFPEAIQLLDKLAATTPDARLPIMGQTADWMVRFGQWSEAEQRYNAILEEVPDAVLVHRNLAKLLVRQGRRTDAAKHLRLLCRLGDIEEVELRTLLMTVNPFPGDAADEAFDPVGELGKARNEISQGDFESARQRLEALESIEPESAALLGRTYANLNDVKSLQRWIVTISKSSEAFADAWFAKGVLAAEQDDHAGAIRCFAETVLRDPTDRQAYALLSQSLNQRLALTEASEAANRAQLIEQTQSLGAEMAETEDRDDAKLSELIELLDRLHRPLEALAWRGVRIAYAQSSGSLSQSEVQQGLSDIVAERTEHLSRNQGEATRQFLLCGIDLNSFGSSDRDDAVRESAP